MKIDIIGAGSLGLLLAGQAHSVRGVRSDCGAAVMQQCRELVKQRSN
jgi:ketopantoate reductase